MDEQNIPSPLSRRTALVLNCLLVATYVAIAIFASSPWIMFAGFLILAVLVRSATTYWMTRWASQETGEPVRSVFLVILTNLILGLLFSAALVAGLWWVGRFWPSGVKIIVPCIAVFVAFKSTFPLSWPHQHKKSPNSNDSV